MSVVATLSARSERSAADARRFASEYLHALEPEEEFSAREFCNRYPDCARYKSVVLEAALEEYVRKSCTGQHISSSEIAEQFPQYHSAIVRQIEVYQFLEESTAADEEADWPEPDSEFLGLRLHEMLGVGAFSRVFRASEPRLGNRQVVVKVCRGAGDEAAFLGRLGHPHITPIHWHQVCRETGLSAIVMPYLAQATMADVIDCCFSSERRPQSAADVGEAVAALHSETPLEGETGGSGSGFPGTFVEGALRWMQQLADALAFAHSHSICHSDIKPTNVLMTPAGEAVLVDFSMANDLSIDQKTIGGTFPYMAPEQLQAFLAGSDIPVSFASDIFSLGVTLYEFLTGRLPFGIPPSDASRHATAEWLLERQKRGAAPVTSVNPQVPPSFSAIVMDCLACDPVSRPESARQLLSRLQRESSIAGRMRSAIRRHKGKLLASSIAIVVTGSLAAAHLMTRPPRYERERIRGEVALAEHDTEAALRHFERAHEALPDELARSPVAVGILRSQGQAAIDAGQFQTATDVLDAAKSIDPENADIWAGLAFCEARMAMSGTGQPVEQGLASAHYLFRVASKCGPPTPVIRFDLAYLEFQMALIEAAHAEQREKLPLLQSRFDGISADLNALTDEAGPSPNIQLLRIRMDYELAIASGSRMETVHVVESLNLYPEDRRILTEAAFAFARNAGHNEDPASRSTDLDQCLTFWSRAVERGATRADWSHLQTLNRRIAADPRFEALVPAEAAPRSAPPDLLLNPLEVPHQGASQTVATGS